MKGKRRRKRSSAFAAAEAAIERPLSKYPAANYRPSPVIQASPERTSRELVQIAAVTQDVLPVQCRRR
jgi:hypothetical protein